MIEISKINKLFIASILIYIIGLPVFYLFKDNIITILVIALLYLAFNMFIFDTIIHFFNKQKKIFTIVKNITDFTFIVFVLISFLLGIKQFLLSSNISVLIINLKNIDFLTHTAIITISSILGVFLILFFATRPKVFKD